MIRSKVAVVGLVIAVGSLLGCTGPWVRVVFLSADGLDFDRGMVCAGALVVAGAFLAASIGRPRNVHFVLATLAMLVSVGFATDVAIDLETWRNQAEREDGFVPAIGWGLPVTLFGSLAGAVVSLGGLSRPRRAQAPEEMAYLPPAEPFTPVAPPPGWRGPTDSR